MMRSIWTVIWQSVVVLLMIPVIFAAMAISMGQGRPGPHMKTKL